VGDRFRGGVIRVAEARAGKKCWETIEKKGKPEGGHTGETRAINKEKGLPGAKGTTVNMRVAQVSYGKRQDLVRTQWLFGAFWEERDQKRRGKREREKGIELATKVESAAEYSGG